MAFLNDISAYLARAVALMATAAPLAVPAGAQEALTLAEVYALAEARNPMLEAARASADATRAMRRSAALPPDPEVQLGVMNASLPDLETDMPGAMAPSVQVMQMLPIGGKLALSGRIAAQETQRADAAAAEEAWRVRGMAAMSFYEIYRIDRQLAVMRETRDLVADLERVARAMYGAGEGRQTDVLRAGVEVARMEAEIARMEAMRQGAVARLNAVLDRPADTPVPAVEPGPLPMTVPDAATLRGWADADRPLLQRYRLGVEQARTRRTLARRELIPDLTVGVQYGQRPDEMGTERMGSLMVGFSVPVFAGRRQLAMREEAAAMERMAAAELRDARAGVDARISELLAELDRARTLIALYRGEVIPQARAATESALSSYRVGAVDFMTVLDARMTVNEYEQELYGLMAEYGLTLAELELALGREIPTTNDSLVEAR